MSMLTEHRLSARTAAERIRRELQAGDRDFAMRILTSAIADFRDTTPENRTDFLIPPPSTGSLNWDTLIAAVIGRECDRAGIPRPAWANPEPLDQDWIVTALPHPSEAWLQRIKDRTPEEFSRLRLWVDPRNLETL